jgi:hypothetical protein
MTVVVKHGPHVPCLRACERAKRTGKFGFQPRFSSLPQLFCTCNGPCLTRAVINAELNRKHPFYSVPSTAREVPSPLGT